MIGSSLVTKQIHLNDGFTKCRNGNKITRITPHHAAGSVSIETIGSVLRSGNISATYGIQDGNIAQYISEEYRPWTSSNETNDNQAITIEISNRSDVTAKNGDSLGWPISDESLESLIDLSCDIMKRYEFAPLVPGENLTWHSMFAATACPGSYLLSKMQYIADTCNARVFGSVATTGKLYGVVKQVIALSDESKAKQYAAELNNQSDITKEYYKVIEIE